jgi:uncharacterized protein DUF6152
MTRSVCAAIGVVMLFATSMSAHHSYADFFTDRTVAIEGDVEAFIYANPHVVLKVRDRESHVYLAVWQAAYQLARVGVTGMTIKVGDHVVVSGSPARDPGSYALSLLREIRRPLDGWEWRRGR